MGTIAQKLQKAQQSKEAIKAALIAKGVKNVDDVMSHYAGFIEAIQTGGGGDLDFSKINYVETPISLTKALDVGVTLVDKELDAGFDRWGYRLLMLPNNCNIVGNSGAQVFCQFSTILAAGNINMPNITNTFGMFKGQPLNSIGDINFPKNTNMNSMFFPGGHSTLLKIGKIISPLVEDMSMVFRQCYSLQSIAEIDMSSVTKTSNMFESNENLTYLLIKNLGKSECNNYDFSGLSAWGDEAKAKTQGIQGSRQSMIDSLITYSYDRQKEGLPTATISLQPKTKARFTESEIAQITAKGYTLA